MVEVNEKLKMDDPSAGEIEELVVKLAKKGVPPSKIGIILRDKHAVPSVRQATGKKMIEILESNEVGSEIPEDLMRLIEKAVNLYDHLDSNPNDIRSQRSLDQLESRIHKLTKYYKREGRLPPDWRYSRDRAALLVRG
ncbi:hypothetical protein AKJ43_01445 [candidate division MSBL1 archaeon SCGC-AAA261D19]|uniref:30S ribosomal protein S15 n=1 Tax=candidate division MSBL1 archaeon SCGC-AAA261D19 TaxID=1698273 RepID=A0A133V810_9EURY|nr:hypothetical protein AKJ43_01445 [candidate division MSBL1 archaeon SCGC-AAA261D19]